MNRAIEAPRRMPMKYMLSWSERPQGSPMEYENAQKRILEVFTQWKAPDNFKIELFVIRVGDWGGYMLLDCAEPWRFTSSARCCLPLYSRHDRWFPLWTLSGSNSKQLPFAMDSNARDIREYRAYDDCPLVWADFGSCFDSQSGRAQLRPRTSMRCAMACVTPRLRGNCASSKRWSARVRHGRA